MQGWGRLNDSFDRRRLQNRSPKAKRHRCHWRLGVLSGAFGVWVLSCCLGCQQRYDERMPFCSGDRLYVAFDVGLCVSFASDRWDESGSGTASGICHFCFWIEISFFALQSLVAEACRISSLVKVRKDGHLSLKLPTLGVISKAKQTQEAAWQNYGPASSAHARRTTHMAHI